MPVLTKLKNNTHWFMPSDKKKCYSYIRWSSDKQSGGTTLAPQLKTASEIAHDNELELVEMVDSGISAFKGKNASTGEPILDTRKSPQLRAFESDVLFTLFCVVTIQGQPVQKQTE
ncbi:hypothetical protein ACOYR1_12030 [Thalassotalea piscium]